MKRIIVAMAAVASVAVTLRVAFDAWALNYDARYALLWARDLTRGLTPDFEAPFAPTPHPLSITWSLLGDDVVRWGMLLAFGALVVLTFRVGAELFSTGAGVVAALVVLTRPAMLRDALLGYQDVVFAALILVAVLMAHRDRRAAVLALLAVAGLLRPEAWVLSGLYWLYVREWRLAPLVAVAPVVWVLMDLFVTGDPLHSLNGTADLAALNDRRRDVVDAPYWTAKYYGFALREPLILAIPVGMAFAWRFRAELGRPALLVSAAVAALTAVFMAGPVFGLPLVARYVRTPSVLLALFAGLALVGWLRVAAGHERRLWQGLAALTAVAFVVFAPANARMIGAAENRFDRDARVFADLRAAARDPRVRDCTPLTVVDHRLLAHTRFWLDGDPGSVVPSDLPGATPPVAVLAPRRSGRTERFFVGDFPAVPPSLGPQTYANRTFTVTGCTERR